MFTGCCSRNGTVAHTPGSSGRNSKPPGLHWAWGEAAAAAAASRATSAAGWPSTAAVAAASLAGTLPRHRAFAGSFQAEEGGNRRFDSG